MKTRFFLAIAAVAIMAVSCSMNETEVINVPTSDAIALNPSTAVTRAYITKKTNLEANFGVFATSGTNPTGWYNDGQYSIDGTNHHYLNGSQWDFRNPVKWPKADETTKYPMNFYAFHPATTNSVMEVKPVTTPNYNVTLDVTVPQEVANQIDIVATKGSTNTKPATSSLTLTFKHILSKVNFSVTNTNTGQDDKAFVQAVGFVNINSKNTYDVKEEGWPNPATTVKNYNYYKTFTDGVTGTDILEPKEFIGSVAQNKEYFYDNNSNPTLDGANMMLLPQIPQTWINAPSDEKSKPANGDAYVRVMYRYELTGDPNYIGFRHAQDHPEWANSDYADKNPTYNGPLYVYAVFSYESTWGKGNGYLYNIPLPGVGGGRLFDENLYDDKGNPTDLKLPGGEEEKPIITTDEFIHLIPIVTDWADDDISNVAF